MRHIEHTLQRNMVNLFRMAYPKYKGVFFAVPNGGHRDIRVAQHMKAEGQLAGVSDLLLLADLEHAIEQGENCKFKVRIDVEY